ncbi:MAG: hypothetical protein JWR22_476 [Herminiimonas sp.]|nr:hypothetical protein [Herminiimonas sp.]
MHLRLVLPRWSSSAQGFRSAGPAPTSHIPGQKFARWIFMAMIACVMAACGGGDSATVNSGLGTSATGAATGSASVPAVTTASAETAVAADNGLVPSNLFSAILAGTQEVPALASNGSGVGLVLVDSSSRILKASITTTGIAGSAASIQQAIPGATGPVIFPMAETAIGSGVWTVQATFTTEQLATMIAGGYFFNVASPTRPGGEIRGQILRQIPLSGATGAATTSNTSSVSAIAPTTANGATVFVNVLSGAQQVPASGSAAMGVGVAIISPSAPALTASLITVGMVGSSAAIASAVPGSIGPNVVSLFETAAGSGIWTARANLTTAQSATLTSGGDYFEVRSAAFPNGEIRGQIVSPAQAAAIGANAASINTGRPGTAGAAGTGITGATGITGGTTITGTPGVTGTTAITGTPGITGNTAITSTPGITGTTAITGTPGITGTTGITGTPGITGSTAIAGTPGITGTTAITGTPGITGTTAITGSPGITGATGVFPGTLTPSGVSNATGFTTVPATSISSIGSPPVTGFGTSTFAIPIATPSMTTSSISSTGIAGSAGATGISTTGTPGSAGAIGIGTGSVPTLAP